MLAGSIIKAWMHAKGIHPRRSLAGFFAYSRYLGYIKPHLLQSNEAEFRARRQVIANAWEPRRLVAPVGTRILVLCPHPDDESIGPGGLLLAHRGLSEIHLVCLCDGAGGGRLENPDATPDELVEARRAEFRATVDLLRTSSVQHLNYPDGEIPNSAIEAERLRSIVRAINPDVVLLPWFLDGQHDHRRANILYARACADLDAMVLGYEIWSMLEPNAIFDITDLLAEKISLVRNYPSQLRTVDYVGLITAMARLRAFQAAIGPLRSGAAEAYIAMPNHEYCALVQKLHEVDGRAA